MRFRRTSASDSASYSAVPPVATYPSMALRAVCVHRDTGKLLRNVEVFRVEQPSRKHAQNSHASPTPALETGRVYVHFGTYGTACLDTTTGKILWQNLELKLEHETGPGSSPILWRDKLIFHCDGADVRFIVALDKATGKIAWKTPRSGEINKSPPARVTRSMVFSSIPSDFLNSAGIVI